MRVTEETQNTRGLPAIFTAEGRAQKAKRLNQNRKDTCESLHCERKLLIDP
jgi:hypothetical protein